MNRSAREDVTVSTRGVEVRKSLDVEQFQHPVVFLRLRSDRDEPVELELTDPILPTISQDAVEVYRHAGTGTWTTEPGQVTFETTLEPRGALTTLYSIDDYVPNQPLTEPEIYVSTGSWGARRFLAPLRALGFYVALAVVLILVSLVLLLLTFFVPAVVTGVLFLLVLVLFGLTHAGMWKTFEKVGHPGWKAVVPIYNVFVLIRVTGHPWWWLLGLVIPFGPQLLFVKLSVDVSKAFGHGNRFGMGLALLPFVYWPRLGFGSDTYRGRGPRSDPDRIIKAVEWRGNLDSPEFAAVIVETLRTKSPASLTAHRLRYAIEAVEAYREVGAADIDLDDAHESLVSIWERKTGADWETVKAR